MPIDPNLQVRIAEPVFARLTPSSVARPGSLMKPSLQLAGLTRVAGKICFSPASSKGEESRRFIDQSPDVTSRASGITLAFQPHSPSVTPQFGTLVCCLCFSLADPRCCVSIEGGAAFKMQDYPILFLKLGCYALLAVMPL